MEHRTKELTRAHGVHTALKVKDSKTGKVILKDNVFEDSKLECEINHLKLWQKKEESRLRWKKEYAIRDMRKHLVRRVESNPEILNLPRIEEGGLRQNLRASRNEKKRFFSMDDSLDSASPGQNSHNALEDMCLPRIISAPLSCDVNQLSETASTLPALLSPYLIRKSIKVEDSTNDPRFKKLLQNLAPKPSVKKTMYKDS